MILVDTSVWVEFLKAKQPWLGEMTRLLEEQEVLAVEPVFGELLQGALNEREIRIILAYWRHLPKDTVKETWIKAGELSAHHKWYSRGVGLLDAALIVIARESSARIWTEDKKLKGILTKWESFN
jgi:predicted nucleic acid-binding protein